MNKRFFCRIFVHFIATIFLFSSVSSVPAYAGKKRWKKAVVAGGLIIGGALLLNELSKQGRKRKYRRKHRTAGQQSRRTVRSSKTRRKNIRIQKALTASGYNIGAADGVMGRRTRQAIFSYQASIGHAETGRLSADEKRMLLSQNGSVETKASVQLTSSYDGGSVEARHADIDRLVDNMLSDIRAKTGKQLNSVALKRFYNEFTNPNRYFEPYELKNRGVINIGSRFRNRSVGEFVRYFVKIGRKNRQICKRSRSRQCNAALRNAVYAQLAVHALVASTNIRDVERPKLIAVGTLVAGLYKNNPVNKESIFYTILPGALDKSISAAISTHQYQEKYGWMSNLSPAEILVSIGLAGAAIYKGFQYICSDGGCSGGSAGSGPLYEVAGPDGRNMFGYVDRKIRCRNGDVKTITKDNKSGYWKLSGGDGVVVSSFIGRDSFAAEAMAACR